VDADRARELLARERVRIELALAELAPGSREEVSDPQDADNAPELLEAEIGVGYAQSLGEELAAVARAEERVAAGTYGISVQSGEPIPDGRLEAIPWAERTAEEQSRYDAG